MLTAELSRAKGCWSFDLIPVAQTSLSFFDTGYPPSTATCCSKLPYRLSPPAPPSTCPCSRQQHRQRGLAPRARQGGSRFPRKLPRSLPRLRRPGALPGQVGRRRRAVGQLGPPPGPGLRLADLGRRARKAPVWSYRFLRAPPVPENAVERRYAAALHAADVLCACGNLDKRPSGWTEADRALEARLMGACVSFRRTDAPAGRGEWPARGATVEGVVKVLGSDWRRSGWGCGMSIMGFTCSFFRAEYFSAGIGRREKGARGAV
ncbi:hypothetical protein B0J12DRAFT_252680 [Macrophomina phaseolina]|uniref:Uncharacterized protein n=1 Tax=Macrophomina phaseolina TaxID=35725 RepID=A0ABQ8FZT9_9PEZI|nr:hypothetical protein B0J12DRAFT_252680 [Macrophomina phaseolina]